MEQRLCEFPFTLTCRVLATLRESWLRPPFTRACLEFLTTLTFRALYGNHMAIVTPAVYPRSFAIAITLSSRANVATLLRFIVTPAVCPRLS